MLEKEKYIGGTYYKDNTITWKIKENKILLFLDKTLIAKLYGTEDGEDFITIKGNVVKWVRKTKEAVDQMTMFVEDAFEAEHTMVPSVSYDGNPWGKDHEYKGYGIKKEAYIYAYHRTPIPAATCSGRKDKGISVYTCGGNCSGSIWKQGERVRHAVIWPETEGPLVLFEDCFMPKVKMHMEKQRVFTVMICLGDSYENAWRGMLHDMWETNKKIRDGRPTNFAIESVLNGMQIWEWSISYAKQLYSEEADGFCGFNIGYLWDGREWKKREDVKYEIGWCGQNASLAVSLLYDYQMFGTGKVDNEKDFFENRCNESHMDSLRMGIHVLDSWSIMARSKEGFLLTRYDDREAPMDACNLGTAGVQFLTAYRILKKIGIDRTGYKKVACEICNFVLERQRLDGGIGMSWNHNGTLRQEQGTAGAFLIPLLAETYLETGISEYHIAAVRAYSYYYREFKQRGYGTSGALDTCCIDKESVIPLLKGGILLYKITGFEAYLIMAEDAAWYLSTWQWHQTVSYPMETILGQMGYDTFGGTAVSTSHHHMDAFALSYVPDLLNFAEITGREEWRSRAIAIWKNGIQGISDGRSSIGGTGVRPKGSSDEGYLHTRWGNSRKNNIFNVSQWLVAWPCAFRLEVLRRVDNWNLLDEGERYFE